MNKTTLLFLFLLPLIGLAQVQYNITFELNMNQYSGNYNAVEVFGSFNNWQGGVSIMSDADNDGIYEITIPINAGSIQYLFAIDTGSFNYIVEDFTTTQPFCTTSGGGFTNRALAVTTSTALPTVCWESCVDCGSSPTNNDVTFQLDLSDYQSSFNGVEVLGSFNGWQGGVSIMTDANNDSIYDITVPIAASSIEFLYAIDTGSFDYVVEDFTTSQPFCTVTSGPFTNRAFSISSDTTFKPICWESCVSCGSPSSFNVTFQLDLNQYTGNYNAVEVFGSFNNWQGGVSIMTDPNNDGIYDITIPISSNNIEFLYALDTGSFNYIVEDFTTTQPFCTSTSGQFTNRNFIVTEDTTYSSVCWESCNSCSGIGIKENNWVNNVVLSPNPTTGLFNISASLNAKATSASIEVYDAHGSIVYKVEHKGTTVLNENIDLNNYANGLYMITINSNQGLRTFKLIKTR